MAKKVLKIFFILIIIVISCFLMKIFRAKNQEIAFSDSFYKTVISSQLHSGDEDFSLGKIAKAILGFDPKDAKSIIGKSTPMLSEEFIPTPSPTTEPVPSPTAPAKELPIAENKVSGGMKISNTTNIAVDADSLADSPLCFSLSETEKPQILIFHTHTTESFTDSNTNKYLASDSDRNLDEAKNISAVGKAMQSVFENSGIRTIHDTTVHDYPSYNGAYTRSLATVQKNLNSHPEIRVVLDVHRDGIIKDDGTKVKVVCDINGEKTAQCMFVIGSNALLTHDNWQENLKLACKIQRLANKMYPGLMRPIILREERFNQQTSTGSIIIEVGSNGNTLSEAVRGGEKIAEVIAKLLKS